MRSDATVVRTGCVGEDTESLKCKLGLENRPKAPALLRSLEWHIQSASDEAHSSIEKGFGH